MTVPGGPENKGWTSRLSLSQLPAFGTFSSSQVEMPNLNRRGGI